MCNIFFITYNKNINFLLFILLNFFKYIIVFIRTKNKISNHIYLGIVFGV